MTTSSFLQLLSLAAIWGGSFLFMRIGAPVLGPAVMIEYRVGFAALFLAIVALLLKKPLNWRVHWKHYLVLGCFNSALPFLLFAYAAQTLSASILSVLNATAPIWGALITALWMKTPLSPRTLLGLMLGMSGVALLVGFDKIATQNGAGMAIGAALLAAFSYGIATNYSRYAKSAAKVEPFANAHGSMWAASLLVLPFLPFFPAPTTPSIGVMGAMVTLGVLCSGVAYLLYFRLVQDVGATSALTVTFLVPLFGILWGHLFLAEIIGWHTIAGSIIVITGTALVTGFKPGLGWLRKAAGR